MDILDEMMEKVKGFAKEIAAGRVEGEIDVDSSLLNEYAFSSIDIMDLLLKMRYEYFNDNEELDAVELLNEIYVDYENGNITVKSISKILYNMIFG